MADRQHDPPANQDSFASKFGAAHQASGMLEKNMRARLKESLFGVSSEPVRLGRFVILERLGEGGMGVVYSAYDPELDRRVALKFLRTNRGSSPSAVERLRREAQALAQLSHPNVVPVHDAGVLDDQVFIVMEFVVGATLRQWADQQARSWREVLAAYRQAGLGLVAAHEVGLVHRDFKPDNVLMGEDGRIRVLDFGLARALRADSTASDAVTDPGQPDAPVVPDGPTWSMDHQEAAGGSHVTPSGRRLDTPLTAAGAVLGTPAYMSPEQFMGAHVDAASDQFSFCVALYEGLYGQLPFEGKSFLELSANVCEGKLRPPLAHSGVPRWIAAIVTRGLAPDPSERHPSMRALLSELERDPAQARKRRLLVLLFVLLAATTGYLLVQRQSAGVADPCQGAERELAGVWNGAVRASVQEALLGTGRPYAQLAWERVSSELDGYAVDWADMHQDACRAHLRGEQSGALLDKRMACLHRRRVSLGSAVSVLAETDAESLERAVDVVHELPGIDFCANAEALAAEVPPPEDAQVAARVEELRARLARATALELSGRIAAASELAEELIGEAHLVGYRPLLAELWLVQGRLAIAAVNPERGIEPLRQAVTSGLATGANRVGLEALARYLYAHGTSSDSREDTLAPLFIAEALIEAMPDSTFVHALLLNNTGAVQLARGNRDAARAYFERALAIKEQVSTQEHLELIGIWRNLALVTSDAGRRAELMDKAGDELERELGEAHPRTLESRIIQSKYILDPERAREVLEAAYATYRRYHPSSRLPLAKGLHYLGFLDAELGDREQAATHTLEASERYPTDAFDFMRDSARGYGLLYRGEPAPALEALDAALARLRSESHAWWNKKRVAEVELARGMSLLALERRSEALVALERAHALLVEVQEINHSVDTQQRLARTRVTLAGALWPVATPRRTGEARARALELLGRAEAWYRSAGSGYARHLQEIAAWRQARGVDQ